MRLLFVATELPKASGITTFVDNVAARLRQAGHTVDVKVSGDSVDNAADYDVVHLHGLWSPVFHRVVRSLRTAAIRPRLVWSPHGMLQKWALKNKWWKKLAALALYQLRDLRFADVIHVTAASEVQDVRRLGLKNRLVVAPLGVTVASPKGTGADAERRTLLFVSRVQRKKGLPNLIESWHRLSEEVRSGWRVRIVGPDEDNHIGELRAQCSRLGIADGEILFVGPKYGAELAAEYESANAFVLPTHSENFGSVVVEALAYAVPVITTKAAPWEELKTHDCGWWIEDSVDELAATLREVLTTSPAELVEKGMRGRRLVETRYSWDAVVRTMMEAYER